MIFAVSGGWSLFKDLNFAKENKCCIIYPLLIGKSTAKYLAVTWLNSVHDFHD